MRKNIFGFFFEKQMIKNLHVCMRLKQMFQHLFAFAKYVF
jgi:hypothetical protein